MAGETTVGAVHASHSQHPVLSAKKQIGGSGAPVNYSFDERVFSASDTPSDKALAKQQVVASLQSKILSGDTPQWNTSTSNYDNMEMTGKCYHRTNVNAERNRTNMYQYNFRAEKLPKKCPTIKPKTNRFNTGILEVALKDEYMGESFGDERMMRGYSKRVEELPSHPDLRDKTAWNVSTESKPPMQTEQVRADPELSCPAKRTEPVLINCFLSLKQFAKFEAERLAASAKWKEKLGGDSKKYKDPVTLAKEANERLRQEKIARAEALAEEARRASWYKK